MEWESGPFTVPMALPALVEEHDEGKTIVYSRGGETRVVRGPWQVIIRGINARGERRLLSTWHLHRSWPVAAGFERHGTHVRLLLRGTDGQFSPVGASEGLMMGASELRWAFGSELRLGGASEVFRMGASELRYMGASETLYSAASMYRFKGASEYRLGGASEYRFKGASEFAYGGASESFFLGASESMFGGASEQQFMGASGENWGQGSEVRLNRNDWE